MPNNACLGHRVIADGAAGPFQFSTYKEASGIVAAVSSAYQQLGIVPKDRCSEPTVAVLSQIRADYL